MKKKALFILISLTIASSLLLVECGNKKNSITDINNKITKSIDA